MPGRRWLVSCCACAALWGGALITPPASAAGASGAAGAGGASGASGGTAASAAPAASAATPAGAAAAGAAAAPATAAAGISRLQSVVLLVADQDKALLWYTEKLGFEKKVDQQFGPGQRWLTVVPKGQSSPEIVLQKAAPGHEGEVGKGLEWVFETADCKQAYAELQGRGVKFAGPPDVQPWGTQARFEDLYGNHFVLVSAH